MTLGIAWQTFTSEQIRYGANLIGPVRLYGIYVGRWFIGFARVARHAEGQ